MSSKLTGEPDSCSPIDLALIRAVPYPADSLRLYSDLPPPTPPSALELGLTSVLAAAGLSVSLLEAVGLSLSLSE